MSFELDIDLGSNLPRVVRPSLSRVQRPLLPDAQAIAPYLNRIDATRWYSNRGPLLWELEERLSAHFGVVEHAVVLLSSGSTALEAAILAHAGEATSDRPLALIPSYTFAATALTAIRSGYQPCFLDVDPDSWMLDPAQVAAHPMLSRAGLVMPVAAYGRRPDMAGWERFQADTGVPVVIDAAAAFEQVERDATLISYDVPLVLSLHATKSFSTAEGGAVLWRSPQGQQTVGRIANFGMDDTRRCLGIGFNGKLSEYHAAVGLAQLDVWSARQQALVALAEGYRRAFDGSGSAGRLALTPDLSGAYVLLEATDETHANRIASSCEAHAIAYRRWYGYGLNQEPVYADCPSDPTPVTRDLGTRHIGLPAAIDLEEADFSQLGRALAAVG